MRGFGINSFIHNFWVVCSIKYKGETVRKGWVIHLDYFAVLYEIIKKNVSYFRFWKCHYLFENYSTGVPPEVRPDRKTKA